MPLFRRKRPLLVIVCTANVTRSPYLAARLRAELASSDLPASAVPVIQSAGVQAVPDLPANPVMLNVADVRGLSLSEHRTRAFDNELAQKADVVLTLEQAHADTLAERYPELEVRVLPLLAWGREEDYNGPLDIADPTGGNVEDYQAFADIADAQAQRLRRFIRKHGGLFPAR